MAPPLTPANPVVIVGAGISGLVCAHALQRAGVNVLVIEAAYHPGGMIRSERRGGFLTEHGPQSFSGTPELRELCRALGIASELLHADPHAPRYVLLNGALRAVPLSPPALFTSSLLGSRTKWSILRDAFGRSKPPGEDESIAQFVRRKFTDELLDRLVGPFVSGIYAGDPERLSVRAAFPQLREAEELKGGIIRGMIAAAKAKPGPREKPTLLTFREGNESLVRALAVKLGSALRCGVEVLKIQRNDATAADKAQVQAGFQIAVRKGGIEETIQAAQLVLAAPPDAAATILQGLDEALASELAGIEFARVAVVSLGYKKATIRHDLAGFGFLVPRSADRNVLGTVWNSSLFPGRAPEGCALLTSFVGGATGLAVDPKNESQLVELVHRELSEILGIQEPPIFSSVHCYKRALPQYNMGHAERLARIESRRAAIPGLWFAGNYLRGPAIGACVEQALAVAAEVRAAIHPSP